jgi:uncharacterized membrane protein YeiB
MQTLTPVLTNEREIFMDVLRGFAILGIFIANLGSYSDFNESAHLTGPFLVEGWDHKMQFLHYMLIEGQVGPVYLILFGILVFIVQIILSTTWLKYFNYGPVEWIWRSATYKKWQPFRKRPMTL